MPTDATKREDRFLVTGHFREKTGYFVDRPAGCHDWLWVYTLGGTGLFSQSSQLAQTSELSSGQKEISHSQWQKRVQAHDLVLIAPGASHRYEVAPEAERWELLWAHFLPPLEWQSWLAWPQLASGVGHLRISSPERQKQLIEKFQFVHEMRSSYQTYGEALALNSLEAILLWCAAQNPLSDLQQVDIRIRDCLDRICRELDRPLAVEELAKHCHLSPSRFAHLFREQMGVSPQKFVEQKRIARAAELLEHSGYSIAQIASQVGFADPFYFSRRFKSQMGKSPRLFRQSAS